MFEAKIEKGVLVIRVPLQPATVSGGGKMAMVASTGGFIPTALQHEGKPLKLSLMCGYSLKGTTAPAPA